MKTIPSFVAAMAATLFFSIGSAFADTETVDGIEWTYSISNGEATIGTGESRAAISTDTAGDIVIPSTLGGCSVTSIGDYAFYSCSELTSVTIPESVTSIGNDAFEFCYALTTVTIPDSVTSIGEWAFRDCSALTTVTIPDSVTSIGKSAFAHCDRFTSMTIPASVTSIGAGAFSVCYNITSIVVDVANSVYDSRDNCNAIIRTSDNMLVAGCGSTTIPNSVTSIGDYAFNGCSGLTSVTIPDSVSSIGYESFYYCNRLTSVTIPDSVTSIGNEAFCYCYSLMSVTIPDSVASIGNREFHDCINLASITIPYAFKDVVSVWDLPETCEIIVRDKIQLSIATDATLPVALTDVQYWQPLAAAGGLAPYTWEIVDMDEWPSWLDSRSIDYWDDWGYAAPYLSGWPYDSNIGTGTFALRVTDAEGANTEKVFTLEVKRNPNKAPVIDSQTPSEYNLTIASGETATLSISAHDPNGDALTYRWYGFWYDYDDGDYQEGYHELGISGSGDTFDFSRPVGGEGVFSIRCEVTDGSMSTYVNWRITVRNMPVIDTEELPGATEGIAYESTLAAHGGTAPYAWALAPSGYAEQSQASTFAAVGTAKGWNDDDESWSLDLPFAFPFYGGTYTQCHVADNGTIAFDGPFSQWSVDQTVFLSHPMIAPMWADLFGSGMDVHVLETRERVVIRWKSNYYSNGPEVNFSATLYPDGRIVLSYGAGNSDGGFIGISAGDGETQVVASKSQSGSMANAGDIVFAPAAPPAGMSLSEDGVLSGTPDEPGDYLFTVVATDAAGETRAKSFTLTVAENGALRPGFAAVSPEAGYVNMGAETAQRFAVETTHPSGGAVEIEWFLDGESVGTGAAYDYARADDALHTLRCVAGAGDLPKTAVREWQVGTMHFTVAPEDLSVPFGGNLSFDASDWFVSSLPATVTWFRAVWDEHDPERWDVEIGSGTGISLRGNTTSRKYYAQIESALGRDRSRVFVVTVDPTPAVGRIYKMTGPAFAGNRLVLRAKTYGDPTSATFAWKRDGKVVSTTERLDIPALAASDFGTYTFTMTNPHGTATTEPFVLEEAKGGVPVGWGASEHGRTTAPEGLTGVAQIASGMNFNLGLKTDGTVAAWGYNGHGGCDVPEGLADVSFVAAGGYESAGAGFAVKTDGSVVAWGQPAAISGYWSWWWEDDYDEDGNWIGEHEERYWYEYTNGWDTVSTMPADLTDVVKVAVGGEFAIALKADGSVVTWGGGGSWEWDDNLDEEVWVEPYAVPDYVEDVVDIAAGNDFAMVLLADGTAFPFGPDFGDFGSGSMEDWTFDNAVGIGANKNDWTKAVWAIQEDGWAPGTTRNDYNHLADSSYSEAGFVAVDAGQYHAMALDNDGNVFVWGGTWYDQDRIPAAVQGNAVGIAAGGYHCTAILPDADGDSIADAEERLLGRDPAVYEDYGRLEVSGLVSVSGSIPASNAVVRLYDAAGTVRATAQADENGAYSLSGIIPGNYFLKIEADGAVDIWQDGLRPSVDAQAPFPVVGGDRDDADFDRRPARRGHRGLSRHVAGGNRSGRQMARTHRHRGSRGLARKRPSPAHGFASAVARRHDRDARPRRDRRRRRRDRGRRRSAHRSRPCRRPVRRRPPAASTPSRRPRAPAEVRPRGR